MTALAGFWDFDGQPGAGQNCARMLGAQTLYGPHASDSWDAGRIALGRNLYRILPEDIHDAQPLTGGDGRFVLIADLRLDNRDELIRELQVPPERARTLADSAILLAAWERWQETCFDHLVGDYAFALWDARAARLVLARDPLGARPLHYRHCAGFTAFASMPKGLHALPQIPREPDEERIAEYLALLPETGPQSFFKNVSRVEAGHVVEITASGLTTRRHWEPQRTRPRLASAGDYAEGLRHHFDQAVRAQLRGAGTAVGAHLSAGFDSSAVAASAAIQMASSGGKVIAFTSVPREGFRGKAPGSRLADEGPIAAKTAALYPNIEHVLIHGTGRSPFDDLDRIFYLFDRPQLNLCNAVWLHAIDDAARARNLGVLLTGAMGNLSISHDGMTLLPQLIRTGHWLRWFREGTAVVRKRHMRPLAMLNQSFGPYTPVPLWTWLNRTFNGRSVGVRQYSAIRTERLEELDIAGRARARALDLSYRPRSDGFADRLWSLRRMDRGNQNKGVLGGWGLDQRDPTTDRRLLEFSLSVPEEQFLVNGEPKALTRRAFAGRLPPEVLQTRSRGYQAADWHEGLTGARDSLRDEIERLEACTPAAAALDLPRLRDLTEHWPQGGWEQDNTVSAYRLALLRGISVGHFLRRASGSNA
jgi:asparagine synthase (glutamine-hydrolysing)